MIHRILLTFALAFALSWTAPLSASDPPSEPAPGSQPAPADEPAATSSPAPRPAQAGSDSRPAVGAAEPRTVYLPPPRGTPRRVRLVGGGTRRRSKLPDQVPLAPDHVGLTERPQPTLHWYSQGDADVRVDFVLIAEGAVRPRLEFTIGETIGRGFHSIDLGEHDVELEPGVEYRWYVVLIPDPRHRSADVVGGGAIRRVDSLGPGHDWAELARRGVWYDAIAELSDALAGDPSLGPARAELLEAVGLDSIATHDRR